ncbi:hypothetical protein LWI28_020938 [Acer negundo]|uniref:Uncharacterized protein n=1 Tax=Acer negundo TaxID=4023 RepID=A0AAD5J763_ACENE|nr:hypothetical protein LWI28_020938 [Acer negundo]
MGSSEEKVVAVIMVNGPIKDNNANLIPLTLVVSCVDTAGAILKELHCRMASVLYILKILFLWNSLS